MENITVTNLSFHYPGDERLILKDLNAKVNEGDFVCLLGQSGCGKSTFLRLLAGLEEPSEGTIMEGDHELKGTSLNRSVVFQDYGMFPWMSAGDNLALALEQRFKEKSKSEIREIVKNALAAVNLPEGTENKYPKELSGGMQQRCAIARSFALDPKILLMDEPFGALDAVTRAKLQDMVLNLWREQTPRKTVFFVTHDVEEALILSTKIFVFGQSPSHIIFEAELDPEGSRERSALYASPRIRELRETLVAKINEDVASRVDD